MKKKFIQRRRSRKGTAQFKPNRAYIDESVEIFLRDGGKINRIILDEKSYKNFIAFNESPAAVDDFLSGQ